MIRDRLYNYLNETSRTILCVGPMSRNCVDVTIDLANEKKTPVMLIASRRQIESSVLGGGYVENWTTAKFVEYVRARDLGGFVILARDHGGPWQHPNEAGMSAAEAMASAKRSYTEDIRSGLDIIHIDPSIDPNGEPDLETVLQRMFELYEHCWSVAREMGRDIAFEVGTEDQVAYVKSLPDFTRVLQRILTECDRRSLPQPLFVVGQTGTKVMEARNVGTFSEREEFLEPVRELVATVREAGLLLKVHNSDYLPKSVLSLNPSLGIKGVNIAPEYGVAETLAFLTLLETKGLTDLAERFQSLSLRSGKWQKWMMEATSASDRDRAVIAGHYVFSSPEFQEIKQLAADRLKMKSEEIDLYLKKDLMTVLRHHHECFEPGGKVNSNVEPQETYGGNILRRFDFQRVGQHPIASSPYFYFCHKLAPKSAWNLDSRNQATTVYVLGACHGAKFEIDGNSGELNVGQVLQIENLAARIQVGDDGLELLVCGVAEPKNSEPLFSQAPATETKCISKPWGFELWLNGEHPDYAFKKIFIKAGTKTSLQYHRLKRETNLLIEGHAVLHFKSNPRAINDLVTPGDIGKIDLSPFEAVDVFPNHLHRIEAKTDIMLYEVSTPHLDDVIRVSDDSKRPDGRINSEHVRQ